MAGFNTDALVNPVDFYNIIFNNIDKFSEEERFTILRFFDKLADSIRFSSLCKDKLKCHIDKKNIKSKADIIFDPNTDCASFDLLDGIATLYKDKDKWSFRIKDEIILNDLDGNDALKIIKDVNNAFLIKKDKV